MWHACLDARVLRECSRFAAFLGFKRRLKSHQLAKRVARSLLKKRVLLRSRLELEPFSRVQALRLNLKPAPLNTLRPYDSNQQLKIFRRRGVASGASAAREGRSAVCE